MATDAAYTTTRRSPPKRPAARPVALHALPVSGPPPLPKKNTSQLSWLLFSPDVLCIAADLARLL